MRKSIKVELNCVEELEFSASVNADGDVEDLYVSVVIVGNVIDITDTLDLKQREYFEELALQDAIDREANAREYALESRGDEERLEQALRKAKS